LSLFSCFSAAFLAFFACFLLLDSFLLFFLLLLERCFELEDESDEESVEVLMSLAGSGVGETGAGPPELELAAAEISPALARAFLSGAVTIASEPRFVPLTPRFSSAKIFTL
jgi:hypothetical protein